MADLQSLIQKLEKATEGSAALNVEIWRLAAPKRVARHRSDALAFTSKGATEEVKYEAVRSRLERAAPDFTRSLDAALTLVPEGWSWRVQSEMGGVPFALVATLDERFPVSAATPALALCIAALRARLASSQEE